MKKIIFTTILFCLAQISVGQKIHSRIDNLSTEQQVEELINSFDKKNSDFLIKPITYYTDRFSEGEDCKKIADSLNITKSFYKSDFDKNGYTDLLVIGRSKYGSFKIYVVMNYGNDSLKLNRLNRRSFQRCTYPKIIDNNMIRYYFFTEPKRNEKLISTKLNSTDLIYKNGDFIEYNPQPPKYSIEKIEFKTTMCFGTCPVFNLIIEKNRFSTFNAKCYNIEPVASATVKGTFNTTLKKKIIQRNNRPAQLYRLSKFGR